MTQAYIGGVTFDDLKWINKHQPVTIGSVTRTRSGDKVIVYGSEVSQDYKDAICTFSWLSYPKIETLRYYQTTGAVYAADLEGTGDTVNVMFDPIKGVDEDSIEHEVWGKDINHSQLFDDHGNPYPQNIYKGKLNLIIVP